MNNNSESVTSLSALKNKRQCALPDLIKTIPSFISHRQTARRIQTLTIGFKLYPTQGIQKLRKKHELFVI